MMTPGRQDETAASPRHSYHHRGIPAKVNGFLTSAPYWSLAHIGEIGHPRVEAIRQTLAEPHGELSFGI
jgi:hypothetical protein